MIIKMSKMNTAIIINNNLIAKISSCVQVSTRCVQAHCNFEATEIDRAIDQLKPGLESMAQWHTNRPNIEN